MNECDCGRVFTLLSEFAQGLRRSMQLCRQYGDCYPMPPARPEVMADLRRAYEKMLARRRGTGAEPFKASCPSPTNNALVTGNRCA